MRLPAFVTVIAVLTVNLPSGANADLGDACQWGQACNRNGCQYCKGATQGSRVLGICTFSPANTCCSTLTGLRGSCDGSGACAVGFGLQRRQLQDEESCVPLTPSPTQVPPSPLPTPAPATPSPATPAPVCPPGTDMCDDPHMRGLLGQKIDWSGVDGGWYCMIKDDAAKLQINVRLTAPLPETFPDRQLITGLSIASQGHSLVIEVTNPYAIDTNGCPSGISPCLANGGLRAVVDGKESRDLLQSSRNEYVADDIAVSASNLPVECRQFGGDKLWARMYEEMLRGTRRLAPEERFEDWVLRFDDMAAPLWCSRYIAEQDLADVQSSHAIFKIVTSAVTVRLNVGPNHQGDGDLDWDGRVLPDLEFWQMDVGLQGLSVESESLSGILGETAIPMLDKDGRAVMEGYDAFRGTVEDYRVSGSVGTHFALLDVKKQWE